MNDLCAVWHAYHQSDFPLNFLNESFEYRLHIIKTMRAEDDIPEKLATHLKLFKKVEGDLPPTLKELWEAERAWKEEDVWPGWEVALYVWQEAKEKARPEIIRLHAEQCGCPWTPDNNNIFEYMMMPRETSIC